MYQLIESVATTFGNAVATLATSGVLFVVFAVIWVALGVAWIRRHETIDEAWRRIRALPIAVQIVMWLLLLPVMAGLWIWQHAAWPIVVRAALVLGIAGWNLIVFLPTAAP
jgi:hypothetical protein